MNHIDAALICKSLGDSNRLRIIQMLSQGEECACNLLEDLNITQPTLSYHMRNLVESGLVNTRKDGKWSYYAIDCGTLNTYKAFVAGLACSAHASGRACD